MLETVNSKLAIKQVRIYDLRWPAEVEKKSERCSSSGIFMYPRSKKFTSGYDVRRSSHKAMEAWTRCFRFSASGSDDHLHHHMFARH